ncbi:type IVB secretion system protein IcmH/DotU [Erwinia tasmaniensis]|uniref:OmpA family protein n=1 Tax=Erwinia tasmaniensis (strain DSM 17950 / CFBP 7177 / CIP 109463 / NCPPB 4357 / Et1/99) TaxID=465817 RepID=B2VJY4_ERWT9|nr:type IVB secretion system protein IcmH/DotU [Erwinia tasmaniensis]CAO96909.1 OmpA family protein [Erwinia tasmaniensis Et1/99]
MTLESPANPVSPVSPDNLLLAAALPLLNAIVQIRLAATHDDPAGLRHQLIGEVGQFEARCKRMELSFETMVGARYCLCAVLDEAASQTPWGGRSVWSGNGLLVTFHNESWGGDKVFQLLTRISQNPSKHLFLLEVIHYCLLLGYEGRYRNMDNGRLQRDAVRSRLGKLIQNVRTEPAADLPQACDVALHCAPWRPPVPLWACLCVTALIGCTIFTALNWQLGRSAEPLLQQIWQTPLPQLPGGQRTAAPQDLFDLRQRLSDLIGSHRLDVTDGDYGNKIILPADSLFTYQGAALTPEGRALVARVASAMESRKGTLLIGVYTDNRLPHSSPFTSTYAYSAAQAEAISNMMVQLIAHPCITVRAEGRGDSRGRVPNNSAENRARNRRVEITLFASSEKDDCSHAAGNH